MTWLLPHTYLKLHYIHGYNMWFDYYVKKNIYKVKGRGRHALKNIVRLFFAMESNPIQSTGLFYSLLFLLVFFTTTQLSSIASVMHWQWAKLNIIPTTFVTMCGERSHVYIFFIQSMLSLKRKRNWRKQSLLFFSTRKRSEAKMYGNGKEEEEALIHCHVENAHIHMYFQ